MPSALTRHSESIIHITSVINVFVPDKYLPPNEFWWRFLKCLHTTG